MWFLRVLFTVISAGMITPLFADPPNTTTISLDEQAGLRMNLVEIPA
ncbi:MAG: hypothetical protein WA705_25760 [Candidatus Ozemobacteraceae bacterium]